MTGVDIRCPQCDSDNPAEITVFDRILAEFICRNCGLRYSRIPVINAPCIGPVQGCKVPTPEDLLRAAGIGIYAIQVPHGPGLGYMGNATS